MAKTIKKVSSSSSWNPAFKMPAFTSKKEKVGGKRFVLTDGYAGFLLAILPKGTILVECEDKYYQPYIGGSKLFFRIGEVILEKLKLEEIKV